MSIEELVREIVSKICPFHGMHPKVTIPECGPVHVSACCEEFHQFIEAYINDKTEPSRNIKPAEPPSK